MKAIGSVLSAPLKLVGLVPKMPKLPAMLPAPTRDAAADQISVEDELRRRRGGAADVITGGALGEADAGATGKQTLGS